MRADRTDASRLIQYDAKNLKFDGAESLRQQIVRFVGGIKGPRQKPVSEKQIVGWFRSTDPDFVRTQLEALIVSGDVWIMRKNLTSGTYVYVVPSKAET